MAIELIYIVIFSVVVLLVLLLMDILHYKLGVKKIYIRPLAHVVITCVSILVPFMFASIAPAMIVSILFIVVLYYTRGTSLFAAIHGEGYKSFGDILVPATVFLCFWMSLYTESLLYYFLPLLLAGISDSLAAVAGQLVPMGYYKIYKREKTLSGSLTFLFTSLLLSVLILYFVETSYSPFIRIFIAIVVSLIATVTEGLTRPGWDNFTIPISITLTLLLIDNYLA